MHGWYHEPGQALTGAALSVCCPVPSVSWPSAPHDLAAADFARLGSATAGLTTEGLNTMTYTVLARRYRAGAFGQVVGQEPISKTLRSAIASGRVAHAYLFTGTRGVGKRFK